MVSPWSVTVAPEETAKTDSLSPVASTTAGAWPGHCSIVTVVETLTASSTVPATSMVAPEPATERAWEMVLQGRTVEHGLLSFPVEPVTKSVVTAPAGTAMTRPTPRLPTRPSMPTAKTSTRRSSLPRVVPRPGGGPLFRPGKSQGMRRPPARATACLIDGSFHRIEVSIRIERVRHRVVRSGTGFAVVRRHNCAQRLLGCSRLLVSFRRSEGLR